VHVDRHCTAWMFSTLKQCHSRCAATLMASC
jgi:hypothetical protein